MISEFDYTYDLTGQLISKTENQPQIGSNPTFTYDYDAQGQLTGDGTNSYDYDPNGNRATGYTTGAGNRLLDDGTWTYHYDNEGNMTVKELQGTSLTWTYYYDNGNHLTHVERRTDGTNVDFSETYGYDVYGNRIQTDIDSNGADAGGVTTTKFAPDGWNSAKPSPVGNENWDVLADLQDDGSWTTGYLRGDQVDELLGRIEKSDSTLTPSWYLTDSLGSVRDIQSDGSTWESVSYDSFGNITSSDPATRGRYGWTGRELDAATGLQFNRARFYDSATGRWISQDPMGFDAGDSNLYRYVNNKVAKATDPSGFILTVATDNLTVTGGKLSDGIQQKIRKTFPDSKEFERLAKSGVFSFIGGQSGSVDLAVQVATEMATSGYAYKFADWSAFLRNLAYRDAIVGECKIFSQRKFGFPPKETIAFGVKASTKGWNNVRLDATEPWYGIEVKKGVKAAEGLEDILKATASEIGFNCNSALVLIYLRAEMDMTVDENAFNQKYGGLILGTGDLWSQFEKYQPVQVSASGGANDLVTGDWVQFRTASAAVTPIWRAENAIVIKSNENVRFFAHLPWTGPTVQYPRDKVQKLTDIYTELGLKQVLGSMELKHIGAIGPYSLDADRWIPLLS